MATDQEKEQIGELEAVNRELEGLKQEKETLTRQLEDSNYTIAKFEQALASKESEAASLRQALTEAEKKLSEVTEALTQAVAGYKALVVEQYPGILSELITGNSIDEVNESLKNAQALIDRVRQEMEAEASKTRVPAGAPQRAPLDLSALSPREKIQYAIGGNK